MPEITRRNVESLKTAYQTAVESYVLFGEMDSEHSHGRLEFIADLLADILADLGVDTELLANEATSEQFSPFGPGALDEDHLQALSKVSHRGYGRS